MKKIILAFVFIFSIVSLSQWQDDQGLVKAQDPTLHIEFSPSKTTPNGSYDLKVNVGEDGPGYEGLLDYDLRYCPLDLDPDECYQTSGNWGSYYVVTGTVTVDLNGLGVAEGIYLTRYKRRNINESWSNFDVLMLDAQATLNDVTYSDMQISQPPIGSYMIFKDNESEGYTRIDIETDPCELGGYTMRFTKTNEGNYWNAGSSSALRWCVKNTSNSGGLGETLLSPGGTRYTFSDGMPTAANQINVVYTGNGFGFTTTQGLLGDFGTFANVDDDVKYDEYMADVDMQMHYTLLPEDRKVPTGLSNNAQTIVDLAFGHPLHASENREEGFDFWHTEALAPTNGGTIKMRYVEVGAEMLNNTFPDINLNIKWNVTEDWEWRQDGIITAIKQWENPDKLCWRNGYTCVTSAESLVADLELVAFHIPSSSDKLVLSLDDNSIYNDESYTLNVKFQDSNEPYHGFLDIQAQDGSSNLWKDIENKPIYVSNGKVTVGPDAYGNISNETTITFYAKPFLTNSSISSTKPLTGYIANASTAQYSDAIDLTIMPRPYYVYLALVVSGRR